MPQNGSRRFNETASSLPATSTPVQLSMFDRPTSLDMRSAISSLVSAAGLTPSDLPDGLTTALCGPDHVPASRSATPDAGTASPTSVTSGLIGSGLSPSNVLQSFLESRLRAREFGSTTHSLTWKDWATPAGRRICRLRASAHHKIAPGSGSYPTPRAAGGKAGPDYAKSSRSKTGLSLPTVLGGMPNPMWLAWLMGYPAQWVNAAPSAMRSSRKSLQNSSERARE